ncbi:MAG: dicarboxylate/amino acid:cation symporter [Brevundimonas sp. 32-68-21]|jgi:proton glutamate symport protein|uniref:Dicarboxylate/amino acid:cation symporter n=1 Tax=Brevundimonas mediterranea TaxID=74329 RepID=A0AB37E9D3_9CAUL|nr:MULTISPECIES: cation:dicarboxylase symporter family transporter [Brevundimonas]EDX79639.1 transporter, DAACS family [Brevundimonas sp. BAL3]MBA4330967.1 dicarboxylate/amino acid:cation symporter [Brevundimonas sp.]OYX79244.1 MAG: dicarboxylate/amino acid:cation symporter [Brevundimonas sp. 32-68-21]QIH73545.1 dicarboxylate/amino acid:cation symporter [Brevundimonas mediterranea]
MNRSRVAAFFTSLSFFVIAALAAGVVVGALAQETDAPWLTGALGVVESLGQVWLNALRMTVIPLVFSLLVTGIVSIADAAATGRIAVRSLTVFGLLLVGATVYAILAGLGLLALWPIDPEAGRALLAGVPADSLATVGEAARTDGLRAFLASLAPANLIKAAADDGVLAVVVFALAFGFAATRIKADLRRPLAGFFEAVAETLVVIVHWVLLAAPFGVFALALGVGLRAGLGVAGTLAHYVAIVCLSQIGLILLIYVVATVWGRISLGRFARAVAPAQVVAVSTQSSLASLPVMIERARDWLGVPQTSAGLVLPLAVAVFRITSPVANLAVCLYVAQLNGVELSLAALVAGGLTAIAVSIASVGLPGQVSFFASVGPICLAMGLPLGVLPLLLAVEVIPDIFRTVGNVTGDLAATRIVAGEDGEEAAAEAA